MNTYTVKQLAELAGVSVRTLHYYDSIDLLKPSQRTEKEYRLYGTQELLRLQQIMLYREMEMPLQEIKSLLDDPSFNIESSLKTHKRRLLEKKSRYTSLIETIDKTLQKIQDDSELVTDQELYGGFTPEQRERYDREAKEKYGDMYELSQKNVRNMTKGQWKDLGKEAEDFSTILSTMLDKDPASPEVQEQVKRHHAWIEHFYPCTKEMYLGLASLYVENPEFTAHYDRFAPGLAAYLSKAMTIFAEKL